MSKQLIILVGLAAAGCGQLTKVHDRNVAVEAGQAAYAKGDVASAAEAFETALAAKAKRVPDPRLILNLGHAQLRAAQANAARTTYGRVLANSPATLGSVARQQLAVLAAHQGQVAQAVGLLRQALVLNPTNSGARYDYEVLSDYLARQQAPAIPPPATGNGSDKKGKDKQPSEGKNPAEKEGTDKIGEAPKPDQPQNPANSPESQPNEAGQADSRRPSGTPGNSAAGGRGAGQGERQPVASGATPGPRRGLDRSGPAGAAASNGTSRQPGSEASLPEDMSLQTQRERLKAMNLSPAQAQQVLEALRAQEQQYLQQLTRPATSKPDPNKPTW